MVEAKYLLTKLDSEDQNVTHTVQTSEAFLKNLIKNSKVFKEIIEQEVEESAKEVSFKLNVADPSKFTQEDLEAFSTFIEYYNEDPSVFVTMVESVQTFNRVRKVMKELKLAKEIKFD